MEKYVFKNILGEFILDENLEIVENSKKTAGLKKVDEENIYKILENFKDKKYFQKFYEKNLEIAKQKIKESVNEDNLITQAIGSIEDIDKAVNFLAKRLREWYELYNPEFSREEQEHEKFVDSILNKEITKKDNSMGADLSKENLKPVLELAEQVSNLYKLRKKHENYLSGILDKYCKNILAVAGITITAKLIKHAGSLKRLAMIPASTIQLFGAEKALFRHMATGSKPPKFGLISQHPLILKAKRKDYGKIARLLADKISIAAKVDYFKGEFIGEKLMKDIEEKLK